MASPNECLAGLDAANAGRLNDDELDAIAAQLQRAKKAKEGLEGLDRAMFDAAEQIANDAELAAKIEKRNRLINIIRESELLTLARAAKDATGDVSMGLEAAMVGINTPFAGSRASVDAKSNGILRASLGGMVADLKREGVHDIFTSNQISREVAKELWDLSLSKPKGNATTSNDAKKIAAIVNKYRRAAIERENRAGAYIRYRSGFVTRQTHDPAKMRRAGFNKWAESVRNRIDWAAMRVPDNTHTAYLKEAYDALVTGVRIGLDEFEEADIEFAFKGPGNLAKKESASRVILFKSADDWFDYNEGFGRASLNEGVMGDLRRSAQATALMDTFGTNPRAMFDRVKDRLMAENRGDAAQVDRLKRQTLEWQFAEIDGSVNIAGNYTAAAIGRATRAIQSMAKLGGAVISSITDLAAAASERRYQGRSIADSWMDAFTAPMEGLASAGDKRRYAEMVGVGIDAALGDFVSRFAAQDDAPGRISKLMSLFFKLNLLGPWTDSVKRGIGLAMARDLGMAAQGDWASLANPMKRSMLQYGIKESDWPAVRGAVIEVDGKTYIDPSAVRMAGETRAALRERDRISGALSAYIADRGDFASPTPGARERAMLRFGLPPGTPAGEAVRFMMQFKAFPVTMITKVLGREIHGHGAKSITDALVRGQGDRLGMASFLAGGIALGYVALQAKELAKGKEPRPMNLDTLRAAALQSGGLGIYGDFLFGEANRFGGGVLETVAGPSIGEAATAIELLQRLRATTFEGEAPDTAGEAIRFVKGNTPFANLIWTKTAMDYLIVYRLQEMANPGYLRRMERRIKRENNQEFFYPPSQVVPRGG